jgi:SAM-dependent methyltransferase
MRRPFYSSFAWAYDLLIEEPVSDRLGFVIEMWAKRGIVPGALVVDAGCGTGRYSIALAEHGFRVIGIDASSEQIDEARKRQEKSGRGAEFRVADICITQPITGADAILCRGVLNDLTEDASRKAAFHSFASMLRTGGVLVLDVREWNATEVRKRNHPVFEREMSTDRGQLKFHSVTELHPETRTLVVHETHRIESTNEAVQEEKFTFTMRCWTREELDASLRGAGFVSTEYFGDYNALGPLGAGDRIVAVASRRDDSE